MKQLPPEERLVARLSSLFATRRRDVRMGIGDDAAVLAIGGDAVVTTDTLVSGVDFLPDTDPRRLGRKALNVNLSDLAAMGATPLYALLVLGLPKKTDAHFLDALLEGVRSAATEFGVAVVGGDLSASDTLFASVTAIGRPPRRGVLTRSGARPGDALFVSGTLGAAAAGLALLLAGHRLGADGSVRRANGRRLAASKSADVARLIRHQLDPRPQVEVGRALAEGGLASAAIDVSDGFARDLHRLARASGVGARVDLAALPVDSALPGLEGLAPVDPTATALYGGEDFGLLFTVPKRKLDAVEALAGRFALRRVGTIDGTGRVTAFRDHRIAPLPDAGFDHFGG